jgi:tetratricopeptide (TPR) repeat protein
MLEELLSLAMEAGIYAFTDTESSSVPASGGGILSAEPTYELDEAYDLATKIIEKDPSQVQAYFLRGVICQTMQHYEDALEDFTEAIKLDPSHARALMLRSEVNFRLGDDEQGKADRQAALRLDPNVG